MKIHRHASRTTRWKRIPIRAGLISCVGLPWVAASEEFKIEIRPRTDAHVQEDIRASAEFRKMLLSSEPSGGLSELAHSADSSGASPSTAAHDPSSAIIIGTLEDSTAIYSNQPIEKVQIEKESVANESNQPIAIESGVHVIPRTEKRLPPPTISQIQDWQPERHVVSQDETRLASASQQWKPVRARIGVNDVEASIQPQLSSSTSTNNVASLLDSTVVPANFQANQDGFSAPSLPGAGTITNPSPSSVGQPILPGASPPNVMPAPPITYAVPGPTTTIVPGGGIPYSQYGQENLPSYQPRSSTIMSGEPFVTTPPCQFDAYYMLEPTCAMQNPATGSCGSVVAPTYPGIPGTIAPPTIMPNQIPGLYSPNNSGFRPLIGFGQGSYNVQLGRGIIGQPVAYVPGQPFRNFLRYIFP